MASPFQVERQWRRVGDPDRWCHPESMKRFFDTAVVVENAITVVVAYEIFWLHSRCHWMTDPREEAVIQHTMVKVLSGSALALLLGVFSLWALRLIKRAGS